MELVGGEAPRITLMVEQEKASYSRVKHSSSETLHHFKRCNVNVASKLSCLPQSEKGIPACFNRSSYVFWVFSTTTSVTEGASAEPSAASSSAYTAVTSGM
jgi:hypothetical protein